MDNRRPTYVRFVAMNTDPDSSVRAGIFTHAYRLRDDPTTAAYDADALTVLIDWFRAHLQVPDRFNRSSSKSGGDRNTAGIAWFKSDAQTHIAKMRDLTSLIERYDVYCEQIRTQRPGYVVYEDAYQIIAEPFSDSGIS